jgi:hypothetical protein
MRRPVRIAAVLAALVVFLAISAGLARVLSANGAERSAIESLIDAQARGDAPAMISQIQGCSAEATCVSTARGNAARLRSTGSVQLVRLDASTSFSLGGHTGTARVVWTAPSRTTVVQCVRVRRGGNVVAGLTVRLLSLSAPINRQGDCPSTH